MSTQTITIHGVPAGRTLRVDDLFNRGNLAGPDEAGEYHWQPQAALRQAWTGAGEPEAEAGDDTYAGLLAMVREMAGKRDAETAAFYEALEYARQFLCDAAVEIHRDDLVKVLHSLGVGKDGGFTCEGVVNALMASRTRAVEGGRIRRSGLMIGFERGHFEFRKGVDGLPERAWIPEVAP